jgi:capsular polysaccharide transport system permease protein
MSSTNSRSPALITYTTWKALFLRTAVARLSASRFAWFWVIFEPLASILLLMAVFTFLRVRHINGISTAIWIMAGVLTFSSFRWTVATTMKGTRNRSLHTFPQITPTDPLFVNAALEGFILILVSILLIAATELVGFDVVPLDPLAVMVSMVGTWLVGLGYGLIGSVALVIAPPVGVVLQFIVRPLFVLSGVILPVILVVPYPYREWLLWNPLVHGLESAREGFAPYYHLDPAISIGYLYGWAAALMFLGLALQVRYGRRVAKAE